MTAVGKVPHPEWDEGAMVDRAVDGLDRLWDLGVDPERLIIGHCGDSEDLDYLRELMDAGCTIGMDRFGMENISRRVIPHLLELGAGPDDIDQMLVGNPARLLAPHLSTDGAP